MPSEASVARTGAACGSTSGASWAHAARTLAVRLYWSQNCAASLASGAPGIAVEQQAQLAPGAVFLADARQCDQRAETGQAINGHRHRPRLRIGWGSPRNLVVQLEGGLHVMSRIRRIGLAQWLRSGHRQVGEHTDSRRARGLGRRGRGAACGHQTGEQRERGSD